MHHVAPLPSVDSSAVSVPEPPVEPPQPRRPDIGPGAVLTLVNGVLAGVASVFVGTRSVLVTVIAVVVAVTLAAMMLAFRR